MNMRLRKKHSGFGVIGWIVAIPFVLIGLVIAAFIFCEMRKAYWDTKVKEMCEIDGGMRIYETVELSEDEYNLYKSVFGKYSFPRERHASDEIQIVSKNVSTYVRHSNPEVRRNELSIIRKTDGKLLGVRVSYSRVGGDLIALHPSSFRCPQELENTFSAIVHKDKEAK